MATMNIEERAKEYIRLEQDDQFRAEVEDLLARRDRDELNDRFYADLEFGTGGLRGVIGGGFNRMNPFVVQRATQGLATYTLRTQGEAASAVIAHDSRRYSATFALQSALVLAGNGIKTWLFPSLRPTPMLSFAVRRLGASLGIVVTASHNPPEYNGYKVYWNDGGQIVAPHDSAIINTIGRVGSDISRIGEEEARRRGLIQTIDSEVDEAYIALVRGQSLRPDLLRRRGGELTVVYTPLHGTGAAWVERILGDMGIRVLSVPEQREPDGEFPTVEFPNPEERSALELALALGKKQQADLVMATDPDADRLGVAAPDGGRLRLITGNQLGALLFDYLLGTNAELGRLPKRPAVIKTIVTTELQRKIAVALGAECYDTLTGFKNIASMVRKFESQPDGPTYLIGGEESYGHMIGTEVRDKDGIASAAMTVEMTLHWVTQGISLFERLRHLYHQYGYYQEKTISKRFEGQAGRETMDALMERLRSDLPKSIDGVAVQHIRDVQRNVVFDLRDGSSRELGLPKSNVLQFLLEDESIVSARPSGTEPKIKFYASCCSAPGTPLRQAEEEVSARLAGIERQIETWIDSA